MTPPFLTGDRVTLHTPTEDDVDHFFRAWNDDRIRTPLLLSRPTSRDDMEERLLDGDGVRFVVRANGERVGACSLFSVDETHGHATVSYWIHPDHRERGYASDALDAVCEYAFTERRLHKLRAGLVASNEGSAAVLESVGFEREARLPEELFYDGAHVDELRYSLLAENHK